MDDQLLNELRSLGEEPEAVDPGITGLIPQQEEPQVGVSDTARDVSPLIDRLAEQRRREREREEQEAELKSRDSALEALTDPQQYAEGVKGIVPGMVRSGGLALQAPDAFAARAQHNAARFGRQQLDIMDRIDRGDDVPETEDAMGYRHMSPAQRLQAREQLTKAQREFAPTPIQERPLFRAGEVVQEFAKDMAPAAPGYEDSVGRQLGEGLGSLAFGLPAAFIGPMPSAILFGSMGVGEATQRAVEWDKKERAEGRPGLTQDQIALAGIMGTGPGMTDVLPVEVLVGRLPIPMPRWMRSAVARGIGRIGGQAFIEGVQEGGQAFLQNLIAREVYDPNQPLVDGIDREAAIGGGVGAIAQTAQELAGWVLRSATGRRTRTPDERREQPTPETPRDSVVDLDQFADALEPEGERPVDEGPLEPLAPDVRGQDAEGDLAASMVQDRLSDEAREYLNEAYTTIGRDPDTNLSTVPASELRQMAEYLRGVQQDIRTESGRYTPGRDELNPPDPAITELLRGINAELRRDAAAQRRQPQLPLEEPAADTIASEAAPSEEPSPAPARRGRLGTGLETLTRQDFRAAEAVDRVRGATQPEIEPVFTREEIRVGKPRTTRRKSRSGAISGRSITNIESPTKVTNPENWRRLSNTSATAASILGSLSETGAAPKRKDPVWSVFGGPDGRGPLLHRGLTYAEAVERAKDYVESANPAPAVAHESATEATSSPEAVSTAEEAEADPAPTVGQETAISDDTRRSFREILSGKAPRRQWARQLGVSEDQLQNLIDGAVQEGLLRVDRNGVVRRTARAKQTAPAAPRPAERAAVREPGRSVTAPEAPRPAEGPSLSDAEQAVGRAILEAFPGHANRLMLRDLLPRVPSLPKAQFDRALLGLQGKGLVTLFQLDNVRDITEADRAAAVPLGAGQRHFIFGDEQQRQQLEAALSPARPAPEGPEAGSPEDLAQREAAARAVMESDEWKAATAAPAFETNKVEGYLSEEWKANRRYVGPDGSVIGDYYDALNHLMDQAYAAVPGGVANERKLYIVMGYPGAGKSTIINSLRAQKRAAHIVADDAKVIIPEYDGGRNSGGVHEESSDIASTLTAMALSTGDNLIIEKLGSSENSITKWIRAAKSEGYTVTLINVDVPKAIAMERAVARYRRTGRAVPLSVYDDLRITDLYNIINSQGVTDDQATIQWQEPQGWRITEAGPELANLPLESRTRPALAEGDQPRVRRQPRLGADREEGRLGGREGRRPEGPGAPEGPVASLSIPPEIRLARAIETREAITGKPVNSIVLDYAARIEEARGTDAFDSIMEEIRKDRLFLKADAHDLAALVGTPVTKSATKKAALETVERRHRDLMTGRRMTAESDLVMAAIAGLVQRELPPEFIDIAPEIELRLTEEIERMLPPEVAVRVVDRINQGGIPLSGRYNHFARLVEVSLMDGPERAGQIGRHEVIHVLRRLGLFTDAEWNLLTERAKKVINPKSWLIDGQQAVGIYRRFYRDQGSANGLSGDTLNAFVEEMIDEEYVAKLAETWAGGASFGRSINGILRRIQQFFEALGNALRGLGFDTVESIFARVGEGEVARRDTRTPPPIFDELGRRPPSAASTQEGRAALEALRGGRVSPVSDLPPSTPPDIADVIRSIRTSGQGVGIPLKLRGTLGLPEGDVSALAIRAFHGSPHDFDRFSLEHIGRGEGAQAFGWGLYFAELEGVARSYREALSALQRIGHDSIDASVRAIADAAGHSGSTRIEPARLMGGKTGWQVFAVERPATLLRAAQERVIGTIEDLGNGRYFPHSLDNPAALLNKGRLYEVRINADPDEFLDWDKPLSEQSEKVRAIVESNPKVAKSLGFQRNFLRQEPTGKAVYRAFASGPEADPKSGVAATAALREAGIPGIRYLDQGSRAAGEGSYNYVVFDDSIIEIVAKDGQPVSREDFAAASIRSVPGEPQPRSFNIEGFTGSVTSSVDENGNRVRTYRVSEEDIGSSDRREPADAGSVIEPSPVGFAILKEQDDGSWSVSMVRIEPDHRRQGVPSRLFRAIEEDLGQRLAPQGWLTAEQYAEIAEANPEAVRYHQPAGPAFDDMWVSPKQMEFGAEILKEFSSQAPDAMSAREALDQARQLEAMRALVPPEAFEQEQAMLAIRGLPHQMQLGDPRQSGLEPPERGLSDLVSAVTDALGLTVRHGRISPRLKAAAGRFGLDVFGQFSKSTGVTRLAIPNDLATLAHEGGHALEERPSTRDDVRQLQDDHLEELLTPPSRNYAPPQMPASGYSGIDLDADTQQVLLDAVQADVNLRSLATQAGQVKSGIRFMRGRLDEAAYKQAQRDAGMLRAVLIRRLGRRVAEAVIGDVKNAAPQNLAQYIAQRFSRTGTPSPRPPLPQASREALSEGWAEFFRLYVTNPQQARLQAPRLYEAFEDMLDGAEPEMLEQLQDVQKGFQDLQNSSPVAVGLSRMRSSVKPSMFARFRRDLAEKGPQATINDKLYTFYHAAVDGRHPMKRAVKFLMELAADNLGVQLSDNERMVLKAADDPYKLWRLAEHSKVWATATLQNGVRLKGEAEPSGPSFHDALAEAFGGTATGQWNEEIFGLFGYYLLARRMMAEWRRYERGELENPPDQIIKKEVWRKSVSDIEKAYPEFAKAAQLLYRFNKRHLENKYLNGFIGKDLFLELNAREDYVPLNRWMDDDGPSAMTKPRGANKRKLIYRFHGSTRDFINPLESIAQDVYATQARFALNDVIGAMDRLSRAVGPGGGVIAERIPPTDFRGTRVDIREAMKQAARDLEPNDAQGLLDIIDDLFDQDAAATIFRAVPTEEKGEPIVYLWEQGKRVPIRLGDNRIARDIFETMVAMGRNNAEPVIDALAMGTQAFRFGVTKAPSYIMVNFLRDQLATWVLSRDYVPFWSGAKGLKNVLANDAALKRYQSFAGISGIESGLIEQMAGERDVMTLRRKGALASTSKLGTFMRAMEITELASRVGHFEAAYQRALRDGFTPEEAATEAAYAAHDVYDWTRRGAKMSQVARIIAFGNAAMQGLDAARRTITGERDIHKNYRQLLTPYIKAVNGSPLSVAEKEALPNSVRVWVKLVGIGMIGVALAALYRDDEEYEEFNDYMKATHWFFKVGGVWWRVPKPFELAVVSNIFESAFDAWWRQDDRAHIRFLEAMRETFLPPAEVQGLAALEQIGKIPSALWERFVAKPPFSKSSDADIPQHLKALPPELQFNAYTSELGKMLGAVLNWSPAQIDNFITNTFATIGRDVLALSDQTLPRVNQLLGGRIPGVSKSPRAEKPIEDFWVVSRFTRRASRGALSTQYFWQQMSMDGGKYVQAANGYRELLRAGNEVGAKELLDGLDPERRAYALLEGHFKENDQDIHPMNRARQVIGAMSGIRREMVLDRLVKQSTANKRHIEPEKITLTPSQQKIVNEILEDLAMREARNALIVVQHPGWKNKEILSTDGLLAELRAAVPEVADELDYRLNKGRYKVYPFEGVRKAWPKAKEALLKEGQDAILAEFRTEARFP